MKRQGANIYPDNYKHSEKYVIMSVRAAEKKKGCDGYHGFTISIIYVKFIQNNCHFVHHCVGRKGNSQGYSAKTLCCFFYNNHLNVRKLDVRR